MKLIEDFKKHERTITLIFSFLLVITGISLFFIGFHDIDLSYNMLYLSYDTKIDIYKNYIDKSIFGEIKTFPEWYLFGWKLCGISICFILSGSLVFGYNLAKLSGK